MSLATQDTVVKPYRAETRGRIAVPGASHPETAAPAMASAERRGPMRPAGLASVRQRLSPWTVRALLRLGDLAGLLGAAAAALAFAAWRFPARAIAVDPPRFLIAAALLAWSLGAIDVYRLGRSEGLARHLVRLTAACGLGGGI